MVTHLNWTEDFLFPPKKSPNHFLSFILKFEQFLQKFSFQKQLSGEGKFSLFTLLLLLAGSENDMKQIDRRKPNLLHIHVSMKHSKDSKARWGIYILDYGEGGKGLGLQEEVRCSWRHILVYGILSKPQKHQTGYRLAQARAIYALSLAENQRQINFENQRLNQLEVGDGSRHRKPWGRLRPLQTEEETEVISKQRKLVSKPREEDGADLRERMVKDKLCAWCFRLSCSSPAQVYTCLYYCIRRLKGKQTPFPRITIIISRSSLQTKRLWSHTNPNPYFILCWPKRSTLRNDFLCV